LKTLTLFVLTDNEETRYPVSLGPIRHRNWPGGMHHSSFIVAVTQWRCAGCLHPQRLALAGMGGEGEF
jgi:hypothetical protein